MAENKKAKNKKSENSKLILFVHGLGGGENTWGDFETLIAQDSRFGSFDVEFYGYRTSLVRYKPLVGIFSKLLSLITPQQRLPKIQDIAQLLKTELELRYGAYEKIYLVTHSMGGLVARKYLYDMIASKFEHKIEKLMLYAVPNSGSDWAKFAKIYPHEQIAQLDRDSDFLEHLNANEGNIKLQDELPIRYVVGKFDDVVNENSARGYWGNTQVDALPCGHLDIVKPKSREGLVYLSFCSFLLDDETPPPPKPPCEEENNAFTEQVFSGLLVGNSLMVLYHQDFTPIVTPKGCIEQRGREIFKEGYCHIDISFIKNEAEYFKTIAKGCGLSAKIDSASNYRKAMQEKLTKAQRVLLYIPNIDDGETRFNKIFADIIRSLKDSHNNLYVITIGRKKLAYLVHGENELSPLHQAKEIFFPMEEVVLSKEIIIKELRYIKDRYGAICDEVTVDWTAWSQNEMINALFWKNLLMDKEGLFAWRDAECEALAKEGCV